MHFGMKMVFYMDGLECQDCADKIEAHIQRFPGVKGACLMFVTKRFIIDCEDGCEEGVASEVVRSAEKAQGDVNVKRIQRFSFRNRRDG